MLIKLQRDNFNYIFYNYEAKKLVIDLSAFEYMTSIEVSIIVVMLKKAENVNWWILAVHDNSLR